MSFRPIQWARRSIEGRQVEADGSRLLNFYAVALQAPEESKVPVMAYSSPGQRRYLETRGDRAQAGYASGVHALREVKSVVYGHWLFGLSNQNVFFGIRVDPDNGGSYQIDGDYDPFAAVGADAVFRFPLANTHSFSVETEDRVPAGVPRKIVSDGRRILWISPSEVFAYDLGKSGGAGFITIAAPTPADLSTLADLAEQEWVDCEWIDGYFLLAARSGQFFHSNLDSLQFDQLDFAEAGSNPDNIVGLETINRRVYIIGAESIEAWFNAGLADFAFARDNSATINIGCVSKASIAKNQTAIVFLGNDLIVYALVGGTPRRISGESVEYDIARADPALTRGFTYTEEGHRFYSMTLIYGDGAKKNWTFDFVTGVWHERSQTDILCSIRFNKTHNLVGRAGVEHIFDMRLDWGIIEADDATAGDLEIDREAVSPLIYENQQRVQMRSFQIDIPYRSGGDDDDHVQISWSDDGKRNWKGLTRSDGTDRTYSLNSKKRIRVNRMGQIRNGRHIRLQTSAKRRVDMLGAYVETDVLPD